MYFCMCVCVNIFSSETTGPIEAKFHMESPCSNGPGHMTKMAAMPIYGKKLKKSSSLEPKGWCIKLDFKDIFLKLPTNEWSDKTFLLTSKCLSPGGYLPLPQAIYMYKIMKKMFKIRLQRDYFETCNKWPKWQDGPIDIKISFPRDCQPLLRGYIHV